MATLRLAPLGLILYLIAGLFLVVASVSAPIRKDISFLEVFVDDKKILFGVFGYTGSAQKAGYKIDLSILDLEDGDIHLNDIHHLIPALIIHPIAAGLIGGMMVLWLIGATRSPVGTVLVTFLAASVIECVVAAFTIDILLWGTLRGRLKEAGVQAAYGNANWVVAGALVPLLIGFWALIVETCNRIHYRDADDYQYNPMSPTEKNSP